MSSSGFRAAAPLLTLGAAALLIALFVAGILTFGHKVATYYTPSILAFQDVLRSVDHLEDSLRSGEPQRLEASPAVLHYADALRKVDKLLRTSGEESAADHPLSDFLAQARALMAVLTESQRLPAPETLAALRKQAEAHLDRHESEAQTALRDIGLLSISTGALCLGLIGLGIRGSLHERRHALLRQQQGESMAALLALVRSLDARDPYTRGHSERVTEYALLLGKAMRLNAEDLHTLKLASELHDIGKIGVPDAVLLKEGSLTEAEFAKMRRHPAIGADMLAPFPQLAEAAAILLCHHERWDGRGYPAGISGNTIPLAAQILSIADAYDAMTSSRPYRTALAGETAVAEIRRCAGAQWSTTVADAFIGCVGHAKPQPS